MYQASLVVQWLRVHLAMQEFWVQSLGWEDTLEKGKATHSSILAWRIPWTLRLLKPPRLKPVLHNKRSHRNEKPMHCNQSVAPTRHNIQQHTAHIQQQRPK